MPSGEMITSSRSGVEDVAEADGLAPGIDSEAVDDAELLTEVSSSTDSADEVGDLLQPANTVKRLANK